MYRFLWLLHVILQFSFFFLLISCGLFTNPDQVTIPIFTPPPGCYNQAQLVSLSCETAEAEIRYTIDGSDPPTNSLVYTSPIIVDLGTVIKARATKPGMKPSDIVTSFYSGITPTPSISLEPGSYEAGTEVFLSVNTSSLDENLIIIRYTTNGSEPDSTSLIYSGNQGIALVETCTLKARTFYKNWIPSQVAMAQYSVVMNSVATPQISPESGTVVIETLITIECSTPGSTIRYTINGLEPDMNSTQYTNPFKLTSGGSVVIKAKAFKTYMNPSQTSSSQYTVTVPTVSNPVISPSSGDITIGSIVTITCATPNSVIRYTTNGSDPMETSPLYNNPLQIIIGGIVTLKAKGFRQYWNPSQTTVVQFNVIVPTVSTPVITPSSGNVDIGSLVTITCSTSGAIIRYTTNGSDPTSSSPVYSTPLMITAAGDIVIRTRAYKDFWTPSQIAAVQYHVTIPQVNTPIITPSSGYVSVGSHISITCTTQGSTIRYTLNGNEPTENALIYSGSITLSETGNIQIKAKAFKQYWTPSNTCIANLFVVGDPPDMVHVQGGTFNNGTSNITLSSFYISKYEITQRQFYEVMEWESSHFNGDNKPVEQVTWFYSLEFCNWLSIQNGHTPCYSYGSYGSNPNNWPLNWWSSNGNQDNITCNWSANGYRLPTEMEWMYAARGGNQSNDYTYSGSDNVNFVAWYDSNSNNTTHDVGLKLLNEIGTFDMSGNVWEWCWDRYQDNYPSGNQTNPHGPSNGITRVIRGGAWDNWHGSCDVTSRLDSYPTTVSSSRGFRVVRNT